MLILRPSNRPVVNPRYINPSFFEPSLRRHSFRQSVFRRSSLRPSIFRRIPSFTSIPLTSTVLSSTLLTSIVRRSSSRNHSLFLALLDDVNDVALVERWLALDSEGYGMFLEGNDRLGLQTELYQHLVRGRVEDDWRAVFPDVVLPAPEHEMERSRWREWIVFYRDNEVSPIADDRS